MSPQDTHFGSGAACMHTVSGVAHALPTSTPVQQRLLSDPQLAHNPPAHAPPFGLHICPLCTHRPAKQQPPFAHCWSAQHNAPAPPHATHTPTGDICVG